MPLQKHKEMLIIFGVKMQIPNCEGCVHYSSCAVRQLALPIIYCQYQAKEE